jgi:iron complex outermembrane recepter protein
MVTFIRWLDQTIDGVTYRLAGTHGPTSLSGNVGTPKRRAQFALAWERNAVEIGATVDYVGSFSATDPIVGNACLAQESNSDCRIRSFTTVSSFGRWNFSKSLALTLSVGNLLDKKAPLDTVTYGGTNYNPSLHQSGAVGRVWMLGLSYLPR